MPATVSYVVAAYNAAPWIEAAVRSALAQQGVETDVVVVDDASTDQTATIVAALACDPRVRLIRRASSAGPAAARNMALSEASGDWIGVLDADDWMEAERSATLIAFAEREHCDIVADNLLCFEDDDPTRTRPLLAAQDLAASHRVDVARYLDRNLMTGGGANLGFLKPLVRRTRAARYDERLRIGEDFEFCLRCMISGGDLMIYPTPMYRYRIRAGSLTRQLTPADVAMMLEAHEAAFSRPLTLREQQANDRFRRAMQAMFAYVSCRRDIRRRDWRSVGYHALRPTFWRAAIPILRRAASRRMGRAGSG